MERAHTNLKFQKDVILLWVTIVTLPRMLVIGVTPMFQKIKLSVRPDLYITHLTV